MKHSMLAFALLLASLGIRAATTGTLTLKGSVPPMLSIQVTPQNNPESLDLQTSATNLLVAIVQEKSNSGTGYNVTISSQNGMKLKNGLVDSTDYTLSYDGAALNLASPVNQVHSSGASTAVNKEVRISFIGRPADELVAGDYTDIVTFTIAAN